MDQEYFVRLKFDQFFTTKDNFCKWNMNFFRRAMLIISFYYNYILIFSFMYHNYCIEFFVFFFKNKFIFDYCVWIRY